MEQTIIIVLGIMLVVFILRKTKKLIMRLLSLAIIIFLAYSSLTYEGAMRLSVAASSFDVMSAYTNEVEENEGRAYDDLRFFSIGGSSYYECRSITIFKVCRFYGF